MFLLKKKIKIKIKKLKIKNKNKKKNPVMIGMDGTGFLFFQDVRLPTSNFLLS